MRLSTNKSRVAKCRAWFEGQGLRRKEFWVPTDLTRQEAKVLQEWMPEIVADLREQLRKQETGK